MYINISKSAAENTTRLIFRMVIYIENQDFDLRAPRHYKYMKSWYEIQTAGLAKHFNFLSGLQIKGNLLPWIS